MIFALIHTCGISSGYKELIGLYSSEEKASEAKVDDAQARGRALWHYSIEPVPVDKAVHRTYDEW